MRAFFSSYDDLMFGEDEDELPGAKGKRKVSYNTVASCLNCIHYLVCLFAVLLSRHPWLCLSLCAYRK